MILTDLYRFEKRPGDKTKMRMDCTASTQSYNPFERLRNKQEELFVYIGDNTYTEAGERGKSDLAMSRGDHITSLNTIYPQLPYWYGDFHGTPDALLIMCRDFTLIDGRIVDGAVVAVFVARGYRANRLNLFAEFVDGAFSEEMDALRQRALPEPPGRLC